MIDLKSLVCGEWQAGSGEPSILVNPSTEEPVAKTSTEGLDFAAAAAFARDTGGVALRDLSFVERAAALKAAAGVLHEHRDELLDIAMRNGGNTRGDAKFDVDGATGTLAAYASLGKKLGDRVVLPDGDGIQIGRTPRWWGQHILVPKRGVAVLINAFNFPAWGFAEKAACALLAGMPVIVKPATSTAWVTCRMFEILDAAGVFPMGAIQLVAGSSGDLLDHLGEQDVLAFTGSADTGAMLRSRPNLIARSVAVNVEADSLNSAVLAPDVDPEGDTYRLFVKDVIREMTQKTGQKCTAVRRILVPDGLVERVRDDLVFALEAIKVGDPIATDARMGPVTTKRQLDDTRSGIGKLAAVADIATGGPEPMAEKGYFVKPTLLVARDSATADVVHAHEVFGPVATILPYDGTPGTAADLVARGAGSLVSSAYGDDRSWLTEIVLGLAPWNGRLYLGSEKVAEVAMGSGMALPFLNHGGPGRAGGGEELGGLRGMMLYQQRTAVQGDRGLLVKMFPADESAP